MALKKKQWPVLLVLVVLNGLVALLWLNSVQMLGQAPLKLATDVQKPGLLSVQKLSEVLEKPTTVCRYWGPLSADDANRVKSALDQWPGRIDTRSMVEATGFIVYLPQDQVKGNATFGDLKAKGIKDFFVMSLPLSLKGGVSVGIFRNKEDAVTHRVGLEKKGMTGLQIAARESAPKILYVLQGNSVQMQTLSKIQQDVHKSALTPCQEG